MAHIIPSVKHLHRENVLIIKQLILWRWSWCTPVHCRATPLGPGWGRVGAGGRHGASPQEGPEDRCPPHTSPVVVVQEVLGDEGPLAGWPPHTITCDHGTGGTG